MLMNHITRPDESRVPRKWVDQATALAMENRWSQAVAVNRQILTVAPDDVSTLNRLGRALMELGRYEEAHDAYARTLVLSPSNAIAEKNLARVADLKREARPEAPLAKLEPQMFLAEPGKAAITAIKLGGKTVALAKVAVGEQVHLVVDSRQLWVHDGRGAPLGTVEQRLAQRIIGLMNGGNRYDAALVSAGDDAARVVIRETYQDASQLGKVSFPAREASGTRGDIKDGSAGYDTDDEDVDTDEATEETEETDVGLEEGAASGTPSDDAYFAK